MAPKVDGQLTGQSEAILREQYVNLSRQMPLMYLLLLLNLAFVSLMTGLDFSWQLALPLALSLFIVVRTAIWLARRKKTPSVEHIRQYLRHTMFLACGFSALFGVWGLFLFTQVDPIYSTTIALFVFVGAITCCYCLQALPTAARMVLLFGATPVTIALLLSGDWYFTGIALIFLLGAVVILRTIATNRSAVFEALRARSEMAVLMDALRRSEEHYRYSVELNPQIPWISDSEGRISEISSRWAELTGFNLSDALGWGWTSAVHPEDLPLVVARWTKALTDDAAGKGIGVRYRLRHANGAYRWCRARGNPRRDDEGKIVSWYGNLEDIHDQVMAELGLRESEERYRLASRATNDVIWDWSHVTDWIEWGSGAETILGYAETTSGTSIDWWKERIHPADLTSVLQSYDQVLASSHNSWSKEYRFLHARGHYICLFSRGYVVRDEKGVPLRSIGALQDVTVARQVEDELRWSANHDPLTGLPNRKMFAKALEDALEQAAARGTCVAVIVVDVDGFKLINDSLGHAAGDKVLMTVAGRIRDYFSDEKTLIARLGGDEFAIIVTGPHTDDHSAVDVLRKIDGIADLLTIDESAVHVTVSAGAAIWPRDGAGAEDILKSADLALYAAKREGAGAMRGFQPAMRERVERRNAMLRDARDALHEQRVLPFYQPKIDIHTGGVVGFEALLRWHHPQRGLQLPATIEAAFDDSLLSTQLTDRMLERVLTDIAAFTEQGLSFGRIAVNGAPGDFRRGDFADRILDRFRLAGLSPALLELEVTESVFVGRNASHVERALRLLGAEGVTIALDDFGTGFASLTHLHQFPVDVLKIDRSFISRLDNSDSAASAIVHGVIDIARRMNIRTVAEGVESENQLVQLRALGCDIAQGFLFSPAIGADQIGAWLREWKMLR